MDKVNISDLMEMMKKRIENYFDRLLLGLA